LTENTVHRNNVCLYAIDKTPESIGDGELAVMSGYVHHTIRHPIPSMSKYMVCARDIIWNIPLPYRPIAEKERKDISDWGWTN